MSPHNLDALIKLILIAWLTLLSFAVVTNHYGETQTVTKTVTLLPPTTTTTFPWVGIQCMVDGFIVKTDLAHAAEAGCG